jgi:hypothetical protein
MSAASTTDSQDAAFIAPTGPRSQLPSRSAAAVGWLAAAASACPRPSATRMPAGA